jgi:hypothetical protein
VSDDTQRGHFRRAVRVYIEPRDWWIGYYRGDTHHYVCPLPTVVVRWPRRGQKATAALAPIKPCWCMTCDREARDARVAAGDPYAWMGMRFIVCPDCGNKRCPRATHHDHACTGSNEPGQPGSAYAAIPR